MESDDDFDSFSPPPQPPSPQVHHRRLKRLKKAINSPVKSTQNNPESNENSMLNPLVNADEIEDSGDSPTLDKDKMADSSNSPRFDQDLILSKIVNDDEMEDSGENPKSDKDPILTKRVNGDSGNNPRLSKDPVLTTIVNGDDIKDSENRAKLSKDSILTSIVNDDEWEDSVKDSPIESAGKSPRLSKDPILTEMEDSDDSQEFELPSFEALGVGKSYLDSEESNGFSALGKSCIGEEREGENIDGSEKGFGSDEDLVGKTRKKVKRMLDVEGMVDENKWNGVGNSGDVGEGNGDLKRDKKRGNVDELDEDSADDTKKKMKKKKRIVGKGSDDGELKKAVVNKRKEEKERRVQREQLHAETQRVLRETRDVGFRPVPVVHKPISSVLEKIRQRKLEVWKRTVTINNSSDGPCTLKESDVCVEEVETLLSTKAVDKDADSNGIDIEGNFCSSPMHTSKETTTHSSHQEAPVQKDLDVEPTPAFRAPVDDTQDLFGDSQATSSKDELLDDQSDSPLEEPFAPSLLAMNLKFDSAFPDDSSSDDEDNEKENVRPDLQEDSDDCTSPKGDPVRAFIDEEAEVEDSDNDMNCLRDDDENDDMDAEELNDMIATNYEERPTDKVRRDELHQKWLEQQDAAGTDHLLKKFKYGSKGRETTILDEEHTVSEDEEECGNNEVRDALPRDDVQMNLKRAKQMIAQMFIDKDDVFLSDEEEETGKILEKQRLLRSQEERARLISPAEDENSREVFGLIKKLNIAPEHKRKPKPASILDTMLGESSESSLKSSFIGRSSDHHLASSKGQRSGVMRSFVFGRDDSNSRSSLLTAEDSSDAVPKDFKTSKNTTAKFAGSQVRSSQSSSSSAGANSAETSLFDILKKSSTLSGVKSTGISMGGLSGSVLDAYKIPRRSVRADARGL